MKSISVFHLSCVTNCVLVILTGFLALGTYLLATPWIRSWEHDCVNGSRHADFKDSWFSVLWVMNCGFHKYGIVLYPKSYLETPVDLFLVEHICANVFKVVSNSVCEIAKFGSVFYFSCVSLYMGTIQLDQFLFGRSWDSSAGTTKK